MEPNDVYDTEHQRHNAAVPRDRAECAMERGIVFVPPAIEYGSKNEEGGACDRRDKMHPEKGSVMPAEVPYNKPLDESHGRHHEYARA